MLPCVWSPAVTLYDCQRVAADCSICIGIRDTIDFQCGYCQGSTMCAVSEECTMGTSFFTSGQQCPTHTIDSFSPSSGPPSGGTNITITGTNLGVVFEDFAADSITVGGVICTPLSEGYQPGTQITCQISGPLPVGEQVLTVTLKRERESVLVAFAIQATDRFMVVAPTLSSVEPEFGPIAGGTLLRIRGTGLDIGTPGSVTVYLQNGTAMCGSL